MSENPTRSFERRASRALQWTIVFLLVGTVMPLGGLPLPVVVAAACIAAVAPWLLLRGAPESWRGPLGPAWCFALLALYSFVQSLPVPITLLSRLSPSAAGIWAHALDPVEGSRSWGALSLDPGASAVEAAKWATYAGCFVLASTMARAKSSHRVLLPVAGAGTLVALTSLGHELVGAESVFGLYVPRFVGGANRMGALLNPNHLAGYLNLAGLTAVGLAISPRGQLPRWALGAAAVVCVGVSLRSASRGGAAALLVGFLVLGLLAASPRPGSDQAPASRLYGVAAVLAALVGGVLLAALGFDDALRRELFASDTSKLELVRAATRLLEDHALWGVGRGAFESAFEPHRPIGTTHVVFTHAESLPIQWLGEWGIVGLAGMLALVWMLRPSRLGLPGSGTHAGAAAGVFALVLHNLADFSLELLGPSVACVMVLGALWGAAGRRRPGDERVVDERAFATRQRSQLQAWGVATFVFASSAALRGAPTVTDSRDELSDLFAAVGRGEQPAELLDATLRARLSRHPADYFPPLIGAADALRRGGNPGPWLQRALSLGPSVGRAHYLLAEVLVRRGALGQALLELRLASVCESNLTAQVARTALRWTRDAEQLTAMVAPGVEGANMLDALATQALQLGDVPLAATLSAKAIERDFGQVEAHARLAALGLRSLAERSCEDLVECETEVAVHADALVRLRPNSARGELVHAELALLEDDRALARAILRPACAKQDAQLDCLRRLAEIELPDELDASVDRYVALACRSSSACVEAHAWAGRAYAQRSQWGRALTAAERAVRLDPSRGRWLEVASYAASLGDEARAREARSRAAALDER